MNWTDLAEALRLAVAAATGLVDVEPNPGFPVRRVDWKNRKTAVAAVPGPKVKLSLRNVRGKGVDEYRREFDVGLDADVATISGNRLFTLVVRIESDSQEPGQESVGALSSRLRTRLRSFGVIDALQTAGIATVSIGQTIEADFADPDRRMLSVGITEIAFSAAENDADITYAGDYIAIVQGQGEPEIETAELDVDAS